LLAGEEELSQAHRPARNAGERSPAFLLGEGFLLGLRGMELLPLRPVMPAANPTYELRAASSTRSRMTQPAPQTPSACALWAGENFALGRSHGVVSLLKTFEARLNN
jgi:hypothetical protein